MIGCRRRSVMRCARRCRTCCWPATTTWPRARSRSATAAGSRRTACPSSMPSPRSPAPSPAGSRSEPVPERQAPDDLDDGRDATAAPVEGGDAAADLAEIAPDGLMRLWMPHRLAYIKGENKPPDGGLTNCPFDEIPMMSDADGLIVARGELVYAVL